jgi:hypothetical protein
MHKDELSDPLLERATRAREDSAPSGSCLDAEAIAAWLEGALPPSERATAEAHAASCERCFSVLASLARTSPPPSTVEPSGLFPLRWLAPMAAALAALTVWVLVQQSPATQHQLVAPGPPQVAFEEKTRSSAQSSPAIAPVPGRRRKPCRSTPLR